jgi:hypothetical protein
MADSLAGFTLDDLARFKAHGFLPGASSTVRYFHAGHDNIHGLICYLLPLARHSVAVSIYGYDDEEINSALLDKIHDPSVNVIVTLDKSQAGGVHERKLLDLDRKTLATDFNTHFAIGQSEFGHQILHTKGFILDGVVGCEGSVNWSASGEGTFVAGATQAGGVSYRAQANTLSIFTCPAAIGEFAAVLAHQHQVALDQMGTTH